MHRLTSEGNQKHGVPRHLLDTQESQGLYDTTVWIVVPSHSGISRTAGKGLSSSGWQHLNVTWWEPLFRTSRGKVSLEFARASMCRVIVCTEPCYTMSYLQKK